RGKVDAYIAIEGGSVCDRTLHVDWSLLHQYAASFKQVKNELSLDGELAAGDLLQIPGMFVVTEKENYSKILKEALSQAVRGALHQLTDMRLNEGRHLKIDLEERLGKIETSTNKIIDLVPKVVENY